MGEVHISAFRSSDIRACVDAQLVLRAVGIASGVQEDENGGFAVFVDEADFAIAREHLALYAEENRRPVKPTPIPVPKEPWLASVVAYAAVLWLVAGAAEQTLFSADWYRLGRIDGARVLAGDWWRLATALTLHADFSHLAANILTGALVIGVTARQVGSGAAAAALLTAATLGNAINVFVQGAAHLSVGASTLVFASVGLVGAVETVRRGLAAEGWATRIGPMVLAVVLLTWFGSGAERTDVGAHWWGFVAGAVAGVVVGKLSHARLTQPKTKIALTSSAAGFLILAWWLALT